MGWFGCVGSGKRAWNRTIWLYRRDAGRWALSHLSDGFHTGPSLDHLASASMGFDHLRLHDASAPPLSAPPCSTSPPCSSRRLSPPAAPPPTQRCRGKARPSNAAAAAAQPEKCGRPRGLQRDMQGRKKLSKATIYSQRGDIGS